MKIEVTQSHIDNGHRTKCKECPIALAIIDVVGEGNEVMVYPHGARINGDLYFLPIQASDFILDFDRDKAVHPFSFELKGLERSMHLSNPS